MKYVTYYETEDVVREKDYTSLFYKLKAEDQNLQKKTDYIERYHFTSSLAYEHPALHYSICRKNYEILYLEKSSSQNGLFWREYEEISLDEAQRMKTGDLEWMKEDSRYLVRDFYLQMTINYLHYDFCETYQREEYAYRKNDKLVFNRKIRKIRGNYVMETLPEGLVQIRLRRAKTIPRVIQSMMQGLEFSEEAPAFA